MVENSLLSDALSSSRCILSVMGPHAGETENAIFRRKIEDIQNPHVKKTFWVHRSWKATPSVVQGFCADNFAYVLFVAPSSIGGADPTKAQKKATQYSVNLLEWQGFPVGL